VTGLISLTDSRASFGILLRCPNAATMLIPRDAECMRGKIEIVTGHT
jgi:hypothetical protein